MVDGYIYPKYFVAILQGVKADVVWSLHTESSRRPLTRGNLSGVSWLKLNNLLVVSAFMFHS